jgi:phosphomannomutase/phosphoglucomutase
MRPSNTTLVIVRRFKTDDATALKRIQEDFRRALLKAAPNLSQPF